MKENHNGWNERRIFSPPPSSEGKGQKRKALVITNFNFSCYEWKRRAKKKINVVRAWRRRGRRKRNDKTLAISACTSVNRRHPFTNMNRKPSRYSFLFFVRCLYFMDMTYCKGGDIDWRSSVLRNAKSNFPVGDSCCSILQGSSLTMGPRAATFYLRVELS